MNEKKEFRSILYIICAEFVTKERSSFLLLKIRVRKEETTCEWQRNRNFDNPPSFKTPSVPVIPIEIPRRKSICSISYGSRHHVKIIDVTDLIYRTSTVTALAETCLLNFEKADLWKEREREKKKWKEKKKKRDKFQWNNFFHKFNFQTFINFHRFDIALGLLISLFWFIASWLWYISYGISRRFSVEKGEREKRKNSIFLLFSKTLFHKLRLSILLIWLIDLIL